MKWSWKTKRAKSGAPEGQPAQAPPRAEEAGEVDEAAEAEAVAEAEAEAAERDLQERLVARWGHCGTEWRDWLARSPSGVDLLHWWRDEAGLIDLVGEDRYVERLGELLSRAAPRDIAAIGLGCTRRVERPCRAPEVCGLDPVPGPAGAVPSHRHGPKPGACSGFMDCWTRHEIEVDFTAADRHRSVLLFRGGPDAARLWVDGVRVGAGEWLDKGGIWHQERFFVIRIGGPDDHPRQGLGHIGAQLYAIVSLLVHDAERGTTHVFVPDPTENWTDPVLVVRDGTGYVYATPEACAAETPDREFPVEAPGSG